MPIKVLGVVCSPRRKGNTSSLVETVLNGATKQGAEAEVFYLGDLKISPCNACGSCEKNGICIQDDDMRMIYNALSETNVLIFGTPIYHDHVSAQAKIFTDRLYAYEWKKTFPENVKSVIIITYEWNNPNGYDAVVEWIKTTFERYYRVKSIAVLKAYDTATLPVSQNRELLIKAQEIGERISHGSQ